jgi:sugar phosphate isomerase/epimerase
MRDVLAPRTLVGYCTNVHPGATREQLLDSLKRYAVPVRRRVGLGGPLGVGLWLPRAVARELCAEGEPARLADWLSERGLLAFTLNGFPYSDFHTARVKRRVYQPDWSDEARLEYTMELARILVVLLGDEPEGSISTLPVGWRPSFVERKDALALATRNLVRAAESLARLEERTGKLIHLDLEPEPGCFLHTAADVVALFEEHLVPAGDPTSVHRHLRVCHDVCHAAVMFEDQATALRRYHEAGIAVGKVQISSAIRVVFQGLSEQERLAAFERLRGFEEDRYLHQTVVRDAEGGAITFFEDLPLATASHGPENPARGEWRVHFHVPIFLERIGLLGTTRDQVVECLALLLRDGGVRHFEVETYAWGVLPAELRCTDLAEGIGRELSWLRESCRSRPSA